MNFAVKSADATCAVHVDMGTTNTRVWLVRDSLVVARARAFVGVRDTARDGSTERIRAALRDLIINVNTEGRRLSPECVPSCVIASGMITSPLGLSEVPHVAAPAGISDIAAGAECQMFADVIDLPVLLIPGVRTEGTRENAREVGAFDVMRGEETLCLGLLELGMMRTESVLLTLGSHWKAIRTDDSSRVASSVTTLSGELIHAAQTQTILASAVPQGAQTKTLDPQWVEAGVREQHQSALARALFCVRLLQQKDESSPDERFAYLVGAVIGADFNALQSRGLLSPAIPVVLAGGAAVAEAWRHVLTTSGIPSRVLTEPEVETAFLTGQSSVAARVFRG
ncbi:MAG: 2-dehydro-3-deoxygalactonokinase [Pyrinomonadaceae bacterium]